MPKPTVAGCIGMLAAVIAGMIESIGDYYSCAQLVGAPPVRSHALNRLYCFSILVENPIKCFKYSLYKTFF